MIKASWGTKRNCTACGVAFYDLNHHPATCPKCGTKFDPAVAARAKRKTAKRVAVKEEEFEANDGLSVRASLSASKKQKKKLEDGDVGDNIGELMEIEDVDDIESLHELSELEEVEENVVNEDDADEEALIEDIGTSNNVIVGNVEDEEAIALEALGDEEVDTGRVKKKKK